MSDYPRYSGMGIRLWERSSVERQPVPRAPGVRLGDMPARQRFLKPVEGWKVRDLPGGGVECMIKNTWSHAHSGRTWTSVVWSPAIYVVLA